MGDKFTKSTVERLAKRSGYICSNPRCNRMTIGPAKDDEKTILCGKGSHICAASVGGPRYNQNQSKEERESINNGIWLCGSCADMIDKNNGGDYSVEQLHSWKKNHEGIIKSALEGEKRLVLKMLNSYCTDLPYAQEVFSIIEDRSMLFTPYDMENADYVLRSVEIMRSELKVLIRTFKDESKVKIVAESMLKACRFYMNNTSIHSDYMKFNDELGAFRKIIGMNLRELLSDFEGDLNIYNPDVISIIPKFTENDNLFNSSKNDPRVCFCRDGQTGPE
ncbi:hypothetical protein [Klebsiella oxytoca]|uniref:hypothetical protein n=1 Tax=Klebsiella oxytoca TaxID=571 RepID=UPI000ABD4633|nr:hypothetical protein [Klebsiella oxytoca]